MFDVEQHRYVVARICWHKMPSFRICSCLQSQEKKDVDPEETSAAIGKEKPKKKISNSSNHVAPEEPVNTILLPFRNTLSSLIKWDFCSIITQAITFRLIVYRWYRQTIWGSE